MKFCGIQKWNTVQELKTQIDFNNKSNSRILTMHVLIYLLTPWLMAPDGSMPHSLLFL